MPLPAVAADVAVYALAAIMAGVAGTWIVLIRAMLAAFAHTPLLDGSGIGAGGGAARAGGAGAGAPKVSVILPARNEEGFIAGCLDSLVAQDYPDYEVVVVDDSSADDTGRIIAEYARRDGRVVHVSADPKPDGWMGKNWACMEGYRRAGGELLLFTDADTTHSPAVISLAVGHLLGSGLDALTVIPRLLALDFWTRVTLPVISVFMHTRFSALRVNDPSKKTGYFFGSFFVIKRGTYESVGMHEGVRHEIIEDGALGKKVKEGGHAMRMVRGEHLVDAVWARDGATLWDALKRLMIPLYLQSGGVAIGIFLAVLFLLSAPFVLLPVAAGVAAAHPGASTAWCVLAAASAGACVAAYAGTIVESARGVCTGLGHALLCPLGGLVVTAGFLAGIVRARSNDAVSWRGRTYRMRDHAQNPIDV